MKEQKNSGLISKGEAAKRSKKKKKGDASSLAHLTFLLLDSKPKNKKKKGTGSNVGPIMLGFFLFVVVGSALLQIIRTATSGAPF